MEIISADFSTLKENDFVILKVKQLIETTYTSNR